MTVFTRWHADEHADGINPEVFNLFAWGYLVNFTTGREAVVVQFSPPNQPEQQLFV